LKGDFSKCPHLELERFGESKAEILTVEGLI